MPKREPFDENHYYHIYNRGLHKERLFHTEFDFKKFIKYMKKYEEKGNDDFDILTYCILPNHFHFIFYNKKRGYKISYFIGNVCAAYARYYKWRYEVDRRRIYFESRFKCKEIVDSEYLEQCLYYVQNNPVKHGIVQDADNWRFKSVADNLLLLPGVKEANCNLEADLE